MELVITIRKEVESPEQGLVEYSWIKHKLEEHPDIAITGHITNHFTEKEPEK